MGPATHLLASWPLADLSGLGRRDDAFVAWAGVAPDLDGLGIAVDLAAKALGLGDPGLYQRLHHVLLHGLFGVILLSAAAALMSERKPKAFVWSLAIVHVHLLFDLVGSRGPSSGDIWPVSYLAPFSDALTLSWSGQWPLNGWPNVLLTVLLIACALYRGATMGRSPVGMFSLKWDDEICKTIKARVDSGKRKERS